MQGTAQQVEEDLQRAWELRHEDTREALRLNRTAHDMALRLDNARGVAYGMLRISLCLFILGEDEAEQLLLLEQATTLMNGLQDVKGEAEALNLHASICQHGNDGERALALNRRCLALRQAAGDRLGEANSLHNIAIDLADAGRHAEALEHVLRSLELAEALQDLRARAYALATLGRVLLATEDTSQGVDCLQRSLALIVQTRDRAAESSTSAALGKACLQLGREADALAHLSRACELSRQTGNRNDLGRALSALGSAQQSLGHLDAAQVLLEEALATLKPTRDLQAESEVLCVLARNHLLRLDGEAARAILEQALHLAVRAQAEAGIAAAHELLAEVHETAGRFELALLHLRAFHASQQRLHGREPRRRVREVLTRAQLEPLRRDADTQRDRARALAGELDLALRAEQEKAELLAQLSRQTEMLQKLAREDGLTGVANRRWLDLQLSRECDRARRFGHPLAVAMIDVDDFKAINDRHSHPVGDEVLRRAAQLLRDACRGSDQLGRYGGEEFMLVLAETTADNAARMCDKLRRLVYDFDWPSLHPGLGQVSVSIGVAGADTDPSVSDLIAAADTQLYRAKREGKNRVCR